MKNSNDAAQNSSGPRTESATIPRLNAPPSGDDTRTIRREGRCSNCGSRQSIGYCSYCGICGVDLVYRARLLSLTKEQLVEKAEAEGVTLKELKRLCPEQFQ